MFPATYTPAPHAEIVIVASERNKGAFYVHESTMSDPDTLLRMDAGDQYTTSGGHVTIVSLRQYRLNSGHVHRPGHHTITDSEQPRTIWIRVY